VKILQKIRALLESIIESPYQGLGKPEVLKHQLSGLWSRRINKEYRLIYEMDLRNNRIIVHSLLGHYEQYTWP
jgi:toxin YoeB